MIVVDRDQAFLGTIPSPRPANAGVPAPLLTL
jgi:hypothetical protein